MGLASFALAPLPRPLRSVALPRNLESPLLEGFDISVRLPDPLPLKLDISLITMEDK